MLTTGETHSVREFVELAFSGIDISIDWSGQGLDEVSIDKKSGKISVKVDLKYFRLTEVDLLLGDTTKARAKLGGKLETSFQELVKEMVWSDLNKTTRVVL